MVSVQRIAEWNSICVCRANENCRCSNSNDNNTTIFFCYSSSTNDIILLCAEFCGWVGLLIVSLIPCALAIKYISSSVYIRERLNQIVAFYFKAHRKLTGSILLYTIPPTVEILLYSAMHCVYLNVYGTLNMATI